MDKKSILLVDDEKYLVDNVGFLLQNAGYEVLAAYDGQEALKIAKEKSPALIILDLMLPKMDGYKVCGLLKKDTRYVQIPIIILTAKAQEEDKKLAEELGAEGFIAKPFESQVLLAKIKEFLEE